MERWISLVVLVLVCLPACRMSEEVFHHGEILTYEQYQSIRIEDGLTADRVRQLYGRPKIVHEEDGKIRRIIYRCEDSTGNFRDLELTFDANGILTGKRL
jgi:hypothetical protein